MEGRNSTCFLYTLTLFCNLGKPDLGVSIGGGNEADFADNSFENGMRPMAQRRDVRMKEMLSTL